MRTHESMLRDFDALRMYDQDIREAIIFFCQRAWQNASPRTRLDYPRFALTEEDFLEKTAVYENKGGNSITPEAIDVLHELVQIRTFFTDPSLRDAEEASDTLQAASLGCCMLGGKASLGDLEAFLRLSESHDEWEEDLVPPMLMLAEYKAGRPHLVLDYLYGLLECSLEAFKDLDMSLRKGTLFRHASAPWFEGPVAGFMLDQELIETDYHLHSSLIEFVEGKPGLA